MRQYCYAILFLALLGALASCRQPALVPPDALGPGRLRQKFLVAADDPSRVLYETEYLYVDGTDRKLQRTNDFAYHDGHTTLIEYTYYSYDQEGRPGRNTTYRPDPESSYVPVYAETFFEYSGGLLVRETVNGDNQSLTYAYAYADGRLARKSTLSKSIHAADFSLTHYTTYAYDAAGNLTRETTHDAQEQLVGLVEYALEDGRRLERKEYKADAARGGANLWTVVRYEYDKHNQLVFEKTEYVNPLSSAAFPSVRYEYY